MGEGGDRTTPSHPRKKRRAGEREPGDGETDRELKERGETERELAERGKRTTERDEIREDASRERESAREKVAVGER